MQAETGKARPSAEGFHWCTPLLAASALPSLALQLLGKCLLYAAIIAQHATADQACLFMRPAASAPMAATAPTT